MGILARNNEPNRWQQADAARPFPHMFLILSFAMLGVAVVYFGALYLIAH
ncbi:MAG: hypothetical protein P4L56_15740 [Candidatus Sulfopaludibacter sp.]|nr:hypothetical protein [Candidatus Sulfopaludibacter sp.]